MQMITMIVFNVVLPGSTTDRTTATTASTVLIRCTITTIAVLISCTATRLVSLIATAAARCLLVRSYVRPTVAVIVVGAAAAALMFLQQQIGRYGLRALLVLCVWQRVANVQIVTRARQAEISHLSSKRKMKIG